MNKLPGIETIFKDYKNKIYRLALSISGSERDAEDILQNTFLKIITNLKKFRHQSKLSTWIYRIAYNEALMILRRRYRQFSLSNHPERFSQDKRPFIFINWAKLPDQELLDSEFRERLGLIIKQIPIKYRLPLLLHSTEELSLKDTADILGLKINSLKTRIHRAYLMVKSDISNYLRDREIKKEEIKEGNRCNLLIKFVYDYISESLGKERQVDFRQHIEDCPNCKSFLDTYHRAISITKALQCKDLPYELEKKIESFLQKANKPNNFL